MNLENEKSNYKINIAWLIRLTKILNSFKAFPYTTPLNITAQAENPIS